jgi:transcription-repair coupling factor (superfamily II helicase)
MGSRELDQVMNAFYDRQYDVLLSTSIVESGLDIPSANTLIVHRADMFGLAQLYQLRGRVGRSKIRAYSYFTIPADARLTPAAEKRLKVLQSLDTLGAGFVLASHDLDIRGAGNLLGGEQSGFITDLGFDTYHKILDDAIQELKETDFKDLFSAELKEKARLVVQDCVIETDLEILIPDRYVSNISERLQLYSRLDNIKNEDQLKEFTDEVKDRFGPLPIQTEELINTVRLRWLGERLGF